MTAINKIMIAGYLGKDPQKRMSKTDSPFCTFSVGVKRAFSKNNETDWFSVIAFGKQAEVIERNFKKGDPIFVSGRIELKEEDSNGVKTTRVSVVLNEFSFLSQNNVNRSDRQPIDNKNRDVESFIDDDIPF